MRLSVPLSLVLREGKLPNDGDAHRAVFGFSDAGPKSERSQVKSSLLSCKLLIVFFLFVCLFYRGGRCNMLRYSTAVKVVISQFRNTLLQVKVKN